jgi:mono/diheme cytochrome c family protein
MVNLNTTLTRLSGRVGRACEIIQLSLALMCAAAVLVTASTASAQVPVDQPVLPDAPGKVEPKVGDPENGLKIARALCAACHLIGEPPNSTTAADVPSFPSIADRPNQSTERLSNWLIEPHTPMPNLHLTRKEIRDLAAYILTLRSAK